MRRALQVAAALVAIWSLPAAAGDLDSPVVVDDVFDWSGFHIGIVAGQGWRDTEHCDGAALSCLPVNPKYTNQGWLAGVGLGYDLQLSNGVVVGFEADYAAANIAGSSPGGNGFGCSGECYSSMDGIATIRGRLGYAIDNFLPYVTAGVAATHFSAGLGDPSVVELASWETGGVLGIGAEFAFSENVSAKVDYLHVFNAGPLYYDPAVACGVPGCYAESGGTNLVRVGLNYRF